MSERYIGGVIYNPPAGWSTQFSSSNYLQLPTSGSLEIGKSLEPFCIEMWAYQTVTRWSLLIGCGTGAVAWGGNYYRLLISSTGAFEANYKASGGAVGFSSSSGLVPLNTWNHLAWTSDGTTTRLFVNGAVVASAAVQAFVSPGTLFTRIGRNTDGYDSGEPFTGYISNLRIVKGSAVYTSAFTPPTGALLPITNTSFLSCRYPTIVDGSTNAFTITNSGTVTVNTANPFPTSGLPTPALGNAGNGIYTMSQYANLLAANQWPAIDPYYENVTLNLHGNAGTTLPFNTDASTNNFQVTQVGDARASSYTPLTGNGYYSNSFNGSSGVTVSSTSSQFSFAGDFTWEAWINANSFPSSGGFASIICSRGSVASNSAFQFNLKNVSGTYGIEATLSIGSSDSGLNWNIPTAPSVGTWYHVAIVRSGSSVQAYWNGTAIGSAQTASGTTNTPTVNPSIGFRGGAYNDLFFNGYISNFRMVGSAVYTSNFTPSTTPLTAISGTRILTCQSNRFVDNSTNAFTLAAYSAPSVNPLQPFTAPTGTSAYGSGYFDGTGDYLGLSSQNALPTTTQDFTVEFWAYKTSAWSTANQYFCNSNASGGFQIWINTSAGALRLGAYGVAAVLDYSYSSLQINAWVHIAYSRSGNSFALWVNGTRVATTTSSQNFGSSPTITTIAGSDTGSDTFGGYISNFRVVRSAFVYDPASSTITVPTTPLTAITNTSLLTVQTNAPSQNNTFLDSSTNNFLITRNGNTTQGTFTPYLPAGYYSNYFDGSGDYLSAAASSSYAFGTSAFTIEMWVYMTAYPASYSVLASNRPYNAGNNTTWFTGLFSTGVFRFSDSLGSVIIDSPASAVPLNAWTHLAAVRSSTGTNGVTLYINGASVAQGTCSLNFSNTSNPVIIGTSYDPSNYYITGFVSNLRVVNGTAVYTAAFTPPVAPLTAITNTALLTCQANRFMDSSANNLAITKNGDTSVQGFVPFRRSSTYSVSSYGGSAYFDGSGDSLTLANNAAFQIGANDFCMEMWVYGPSGMVFWTAHQSGVANGFYFETGGLSAFPGNNNFITYPSWTNGQWTHAVCTRTGGRFRLFQNGVLVATTTTNPNINMDGHLLGMNGGDNFTSSAGYFGGGRYINGSIPTAYQTASTTTGTQIFTPPTSPFTTTSQGATSADVKVLVTFTNAAIIDDATINNLETAGNTQISTSVKKYGTGSVFFDGTGDWLKSPNNQAMISGSANFTIECWINLSNLSSTKGLVFGADTNTLGFRVGQSYLGNVNGLGICRNNTSDLEYCAFTFVTNTWYHVAVVRSGTTIYFFVNGRQQTTVGSGGGSYSFATPTSGYYVGCNNATTEPFAGYIDDVRITRGVARYTANFTPPTSQLQDQ